MAQIHKQLLENSKESLEKKTGIRRKQKIRLVVCYTYRPHCFYAYHRFLSLFGSGKPVSSSSPHLPGHPQRNHGCYHLLSHWNHLLRNCSCCRDRIIEIKIYTAWGFWMNATWDSVLFLASDIKAKALKIFSLNFCMSESFTSLLSHPYYFYQRMDGEEGKRGTIQAPAIAYRWA